MKIEQLLQIKEKQQPFKGVRFVGFDLDGTLFQEPEKSFPDVFASKSARLLNISEQPARKFAASTMGSPTVRQLETLPDAITLPQNHILRLIPSDLRDFVAQGIDDAFFDQPVTLFPDVLTVLRNLKQQGVSIFISSSRPTENILRLLTDHPELAEFVDFTIGTNPHDPNHKKGEGHFRKVAEHFGISFEELIRQSIFIGDTPSDIEAGNSIGVITIGRTSTKSAEELEKAGALLTVHDFSILPFLFDSERNLSENFYERR